MTREEKIKNIMDATTEIIKKEVAAGTMTADKFEAIMACQSNAILALN